MKPLNYIDELNRRLSSNTPYNEPIELDNRYEKIPNKVDSLDYILTPYQCTSVRAMTQLENTNFLYCNNLALYARTSVGIFADTIGSGKTISILALIMSNKKLRHARKTIQIPIYTKNDVVRGYFSRRFTKICKPTIIFVNRNVLKQWKDIIVNKTNLKLFTVSGVRDLDKLTAEINNNKINNYDVVLAKFGKFTRDIVGAKESTKLTKIRSIYEAIENMRNICWERVIIDDFCDLDIKKNMGFVNALFTWLVSSTQRIPKKKNTRIQYRVYPNNPAKTLYNYNTSILELYRSNQLFTEYIIKNNEKFVNDCNTLTTPIFYYVLFKNNNDKIIKLFEYMDHNSINTLIEMINADSYESAAKLLNINSNSIFDMFCRVIGDKYNKYLCAVEIIEHIDYVLSQLDNNYADNMPEDLFNDKYYRLHITKEKIILATDKEKNDIKSRLLDRRKKNIDIKKNVEKILDRINNNISSDECPICCITNKNRSASAIVGCCNYVFCIGCIMKLIRTNLNVYNKYIKCPMCRARLNPANIIYIGEDLNQIQKFNHIKESENNVSTNSDVRHKHQAVVDIIRNKMPANTKRFHNINIDKLLYGSNEYIEATGNRKIIIFTSHAESINNLCDEMEKNNIIYHKLCGGHTSTMQKTIQKFVNQTEPCALIINSSMTCAGLNLQMATDLIYVHTIRDKATIAQSAGRIQRIGRTCTARIWFLLYHNEYDVIKGFI